MLVPCMLLMRDAQQGAPNRSDLTSRVAAFQRGEWTQLIRAAGPPESPPAQRQQFWRDEAAAAHNCNQACAQVRKGKLSCAGQVSTVAEPSPGTEDAWRALTDPARRPTSPRSPLLPGFFEFESPQPMRRCSRGVNRFVRGEARQGGQWGCRACGLNIGSSCCRSREPAAKYLVRA